MTPRLACEGLSGGRSSAVVFRDVDLEIGAGEVLTLLGPNGAGKSTLLLTIAGLLPAHGGAVRVDGVPLKNGRPARASASGITLVPDNRDLFTTLTVRENLIVAEKRDGPSPRDMLELFPLLEPRWDLKAGSLSGGEQQMLAMARALIQEPSVLLLDEMSMGLAPLIVESLFDTVPRIARERGCAVLLVEQFAHIALRFSDRAMVLNHGAVVLESDAESLRHDPEVLERAYLGDAD